MYLPPASSTTFWMFGLLVAAQRGCWKLFQDTPTVQSDADPRASGGARWLLAGDDPLFDEQAPTNRAVTATRAPSLRMIMRVFSSSE